MLNEPNPSCHANPWERNSGNVSRSHFDEFPFNNCIAFETDIVVGKLKSK